MKIVGIAMMIALSPFQVNAQDQTKEQLEELHDYIEGHQNVQVGLGGLSYFAVVDLLTRGVLENQQRLLMMEERVRQLEEASGEKNNNDRHHAPSDVDKRRRR